MRQRVDWLRANLELERTRSLDSSQGLRIVRGEVRSLDDIYSVDSLHRVPSLVCFIIR